MNTRAHLRYEVHTRQGRIFAPLLFWCRRRRWRNGRSNLGMAQEVCVLSSMGAYYGKVIGPVFDHTYVDESMAPVHGKLIGCVFDHL